MSGSAWLRAVLVLGITTALACVVPASATGTSSAVPGRRPALVFTPRDPVRIDAGATGVAASCPPGVHWLYNDYVETWEDTPRDGWPTGGSAGFSQPEPALGLCGYHSLAELAVVGPRGDAVEVGWIVNVGDPRPRLFVFHWVDGLPTCYDACGFVQAARSVHPGMAVHITTAPAPYAIVLRHGDWWIRYLGKWVGYFPGRIWHDQFRRAVEVHWFGEVAAASTAPCADMGNGDYGFLPTSATISNPTPVGASLTEVPIVTVTDVRYYDLGVGAGLSGAQIHYGGPGAC